MTPLENKYTTWYYNIIKTARLHEYKCYTEYHHIIPKSLGGSNDDSNLVKLTAKQHFVCHLLLTKMFQPKTYAYYKMLHAFCMMDWCTGGEKMYRYTSKVYEKQRKEFSEYMSKKYSGKGNNQYGTIWAYNEKLQECKKFSKGSDIPEGWEYGRVINWKEYFSQRDKEDKTYECLECSVLFSSRRGRKYCSIDCSILYQNKKAKMEREKNKVEKIKLEKIKRVIISSCKKCGEEFRGKSPRKKFCSISCSNSFSFSNSKIITIYKGVLKKEVKAQNVPVYKKYGWSTLHN